MGLAGCTKLNSAFDERASETGSGDEWTGDGDGDPSTGDGDTDPSTGDGDGDPSTGDGDGDPSTGDGDGDPSTGDGDGDGDGDGMMCGDGEQLCGGECTDTNKDEANCGDCGEPCDPDQACNDGFCMRPRIMFVTQDTFLGVLGGLSGADDLCQEIGSEFYPEKQFWAWNSTIIESPNSTFEKDGFFVRTNGSKIAESWADLTSGELLVPVNYNEEGVVVLNGAPCDFESQVWTGTDAYGDAVGPNCSNWTKGSSFYSGTYGLLYATDSTWSQAPDECGEPVRCSNERRLYCLER
ncbi:hypothetical protein DB30_04929 [Enhygromyxa salina]|uniref:Uncharacterized protein n=1 Tax=Enhygromyxa salina TaxID=215803 RepID=A0A0C2D7Q8_9BACT|nr:hypothetical protein DB30_04929 [Enhygromyxa salina]